MAKVKTPTQKQHDDAERAVFISDVHVPYHDEVAIELVLSFVAWFRPHTLFIVGDFLDCAAVSHYDRDPQTRLEMQAELDVARALLARIRKAAGKKCRIVYTFGNHEHRVPKFLSRVPELAKLDDLRLSSLLKLSDLAIEHHGYHTQLQWHGLMVEHGDRSSRHSGYTAKAMLDARGVSGLSGHSHRLASHYRTDHNGTKVWYENGCLCRTTGVEYLIGAAPWQQGFSVAHALRGRSRFAVTQCPILSRRLVYAGRVWEV